MDQDTSVPSRRPIILTISAPAIVLIGALVGWFIYRATDTYKVDPGADIADVVSGTWAWENDSCVEEAQRISFSADRSEMYIESSKPFVGVDGVEDSITSYRVLAMMRDRVRGEIHGASRLTSLGDLAIWELVLRGPDRFSWHRTDWAPGSFTKDVVRCP